MTLYPVEKHPELRTFSMMLYIITAMSAILQFFTTTLIVGLLFLVIAWLMVRAQKITAKGTAYASHVEWISRTISIGTFVLFPAAFAIAGYLVWKRIDMAELQGLMKEEDPNALINAVRGYMKIHMPEISRIVTITTLPPLLWWLRRCWAGYARAKNSEPIDYPWSII